jgi:hypothetical protein
MPSPFPGMDPFLEHPSLFPGLHSRMIAGLSEALQARLPEPYFAAIGERIWVEVSGRDIEPDVNVLSGDRPPARRPEDAGGAAVSRVARSQPVVVTVPLDEGRETWLEIRTRHDAGERVVTSIELLGLANKAPGQRGRDLYLRKQRELLDSPTHLVEIDLLRAGAHATAVPRDLAVARAGPFDYHVSIHSFDQIEDFLVYPIRLDDRLPEIAVPLLPGDPDVMIDLQSIFDRCYDTGPYRRRVRYAEGTPVPPLRPDQEGWASQLLLQAGLISPPTAS